MTFKMKELLRAQPDIPLDRCVTDKVVYRTRREATAAATRENSRNPDKREIHAFRCGYGDHYHLGHRR